MSSAHHYAAIIAMQAARRAASAQEANAMFKHRHSPILTQDFRVRQSLSEFTNALEAQRRKRRLQSALEDSVLAFFAIFAGCLLWWVIIDLVLR